MEKKSIYDLKEEYIEAAIENDEVNNREMKKGDKLENMQYADGKVRDEIDKIEVEEKLTGADRISPFGTNNTKVFKRKLETMTANEKVEIANKTATRIFADEELQNESLMKAFHEWRGTNWGSTGGHTEQKVEVLAAESKEAFKDKIKSKTLSELQEMMMKLGFTPSFDRNRIISVLEQEYFKRG